MKQKPSINEIVSHIKTRRLLETSYPGLELKSNWDKKHGKDISAIANHESKMGGWLIVGISDDGCIGIENTKKWASETEEIISNQINQFLSPFHSVHRVLPQDVGGKFIICIEIINPGDVVEWDGEAYKLTGTSSTKMRADEKLSLSMRLPGDDYSNQPWEGEIDSALVLNFAKKINDISPGELPKDLSQISSIEIIRDLKLENKMAAGILFGNFKVRIGKYDANGDVIENTSKDGAYNILTDTFLSEIQAWTRQRGTVIKGQSASVETKTPYPVKALREILANAVAHALYQREQGAIIVDIHPDRLTVRNNAMNEANAFSKKWFATQTFVKNKLLMTTLRVAKISDELGTGKMRIFRQMIEAGKREPIIEFFESGNFGKWAITLYNNEQNVLNDLNKRLYELLPTVNQARIATALVLWRDHDWSSILERLDEHYQGVAFEVVRHQNSPVIVVGNELFVKRWVNIALTGQASKRFTHAEENKTESVLRAYAFREKREGYITTKEAKKIIGLGNTPSENTQLSNLFRKWRKAGLVRDVKRGHWKFLSNANEDKKEVLMSKLIEEMVESLSKNKGSNLKTEN